MYSLFVQKQCTDICFIDNYNPIVSLFHCSHCSRFGQRVLPQGGSCILLICPRLLRGCPDFLVSTAKCSWLMLYFHSLVLESTTSARSSGFFDWRMVLMNQALSSSYVHDHWDAIASGNTHTHTLTHAHSGNCICFSIYLCVCVYIYMHIY